MNAARPANEAHHHHHHHPKNPQWVHQKLTNLDFPVASSEFHRKWQIL